MGRHAAAAVDQARAQVAALIGADPREIVFTSGATEANNLAIKGAARHARRTGDPRRRIVTWATEHSCVLNSVLDLAEDGFEPVVLPVRPDGTADPGDLRAALAVPTLLVSLMAANNEIGTIQDIAGIAAITRAAGAMFHTDAAQAAGRIPLDVAGIDLMSLSAHKLYGPKGIGALFVRRRPRARIAPLLSGGGQERTLRSGTLPTPLVVGFGAACAIVARLRATEAPRLVAAADGLWRSLHAAIPGLGLNGSAHRLPGTLAIRLPATRALDLIAACPELCLSTGSACSSADIAPSHVLSAIGLSPGQASRSLRLAAGRFTSQPELIRAADMLVAAHTALARSAAA